MLKFQFLIKMLNFFSANRGETKLGDRKPAILLIKRVILKEYNSRKKSLVKQRKQQIYLSFYLNNLFLMFSTP